MDRYTVRPAGPSDHAQVAALWWPFLRARAEVDRSLRLKPDCPFPAFVERELRAPGTSCWLLEHRPDGAVAATPVGCLIWYLDEEPNDPLSPFEPRRCGKVLGLYVDPDHRHSGGVSLLVDSCMRQAESAGITDIDVLISAEQAGLHAMIEERGLSRVAVQFTRHYEPVRVAAPEPAGSPAGGASGAPALLDEASRAVRLGHRF